LALDNAAKVLAIHSQACAANISMRLNLEATLLPLDDEGDEDDEATSHHDDIMTMANSMIVISFSHCLTLERLNGSIGSDTTREALDYAREAFCYTYNESELALNWEESESLRQFISSYHAYVENPSPGEVEALNQAIINYGASIDAEEAVAKETGVPHSV